jgi:hypothetical protein
LAKGFQNCCATEGTADLQRSWSKGKSIFESLKDPYDKYREKKDRMEDLADAAN